MKLQIRQGCFETNSSSSHSLQVVDSSRENTIDVFIKMLSTDIKYWDDEKEHNQYVKDGKLHLIGMKGASGGEDSDVYLVLTKWLPKIQYLYSFIFKKLKYLDELNEYDENDVDELQKQFTCLHSDKELFELFPSLWQTQEFIDMICSVSKYTKDQIVLEMPIENYDYDEDESFDLFTYKELVNKELFKQKLKFLIDNDIISMDKAYSCYEGKYIYWY